MAPDVISERESNPHHARVWKPEDLKDIRAFTFPLGGMKWVLFFLFFAKRVRKQKI